MLFAKSCYLGGFAYILLASTSSPAWAILNGFVPNALKLPISSRVVNVNIAGAPCTGTLLSERIVLTAAHCLIAKPSIQSGFGPHRQQEGKEPINFFGPWSVYQEQVGQAPFYSTVVDAILLKDQFPEGAWTDYRSEERGDLLLILLANKAKIPVDSHFELAEPLTKTADIDHLYAFGFGINEFKDSKLRAYRFNQRPILELGDDNGNTLDTFFMMNPKGGSLCNGDSGGPLFYRAADKTWRLLGVYSKMEYHPSWWERHYGSTPDPFTSDFC